MKTLLLTAMLCAATAAHAYEYKLQFTPAGGAQGLIVAGYEIQGNTVLGNCSYYTVTAGSGRGGRSTRTDYDGTCTWDLFGNLISVANGAPAVPQPLSEAGTETVYATSGNSQTGQDSRGFGFVSTPSSHYSWQTITGGYAVIPYAAYRVTATLVSDGDFALAVSSAKVATAVSGTLTPSAGTASVTASTCGASLAIGATCAVTVTYNPRAIKCTPSPYGYAYTKLDLSLITDAGASTDFTEGFTVTGVPLCGD